MKNTLIYSVKRHIRVFHRTQIYVDILARIVIIVVEEKFKIIIEHVKIQIKHIVNQIVPTDVGNYQLGLGCHFGQQLVPEGVLFLVHDIHVSRVDDAPPRHKDVRKMFETFRAGYFKHHLLVWTHFVSFFIQSDCNILMT
uniref:(northern house mosquito) hypothetical protein n=1 Tax=Culex pipiens TaxID=7175 RepID=A0A8D8CSU1_CULPI